MKDSRSAPMLDVGLDADPEEEFLQRRWFAALTATRRLEIECRQLLDALRHADEAWRRASNRLAEYENLTETLESELTCGDEAPRLSPVAAPLAEVSAA